MYTQDRAGPAYGCMGGGGEEEGHGPQGTALGLVVTLKREEGAQGLRDPL